MLILVCLFALVNCAHAGWRLVDESQPGAAAKDIAYVTRKFQGAEPFAGRRVELHAVIFSSNNYTLRIIDSPRRYSLNLEKAMLAGDFLAGVNGGYFTPEFEPVGLVVARGELLSRAAQTKLLSGVLAVTADRIFLLRNREFKLGPRTLEALQAGPFLVDNGRPTPGLNNVKRAARTFVATNGKSRFAIGVIYSPTLAEAGALLSQPAILPGMEVKRALNLDGGRSTGFWVRTTASASSYLGEISSVRNFIGLLPRR